MKNGYKINWEKVQSTAILIGIANTPTSKERMFKHPRKGIN